MTVIVHWCPVPPGRIACGAGRGLSDSELAYVTCAACQLAAELAGRGPG